MMSLKCLLAIVPLLAIINLSNSVTEDEYRIADYLRQVDGSLKETNRLAGDAFWFNRPEIAAQGINVFRSTALNVSNWLRQYEHVAIENPVLRQQVKNLRNIGTYALQDVDYNNFETVLDNLKSTGSQERLCEYNNPMRCDLSIKKHVLNAVIRSSNADELKHYWLEYVNKIGPAAKNWVRDYALFYRKSSESNGVHLSSYQHYYKYDNPNFSDEMRSVLVDMEGFVTEFHAYIRHSLYTKFGSSVLSERGPIPYHLLQKVVAGAWSTNNIVDQPFPYAILPDLNQNLEAKHYTGSGVVRMANDFLRSIGLDDLPLIFWNQYTKEMSNEEAGNPNECKAKVFDFSANVAVKYCPLPTYKTFLSMHGDMSIVHYTQKRNELPIGLNGEPCPGFAKSLSEAMVLSAASPKHNQRIGLIDSYQNYNAEMIINRLFRQALNTIFKITSSYVFDKLMVDILDGRLQPDDYNCEFWRLMNEYVGVEPANYRTSADFDAPIDFYEGVDPKRPHVSKFVTEILGNQFYKGLCQASGDTSADLQNCDFSNSRLVGNIVRAAYYMGSKRSWRDTMEPITRVRNLNAYPLLEFYKPLITWLQEYNTRNRVYRGWSISNKCYYVRPGTRRWDLSPEGIPYCD